MKKFLLLTALSVGVLSVSMPSVVSAASKKSEAQESSRLKTIRSVIQSLAKGITDINAKGAHLDEAKSKLIAYIQTQPWYENPTTVDKLDQKKWSETIGQAQSLQTQLKKTRGDVFRDIKNYSPSSGRAVSDDQSGPEEELRRGGSSEGYTLDPKEMSKRVILLVTENTTDTATLKGLVDQVEKAQSAAKFKQQQMKKAGKTFRSGAMSMDLKGARDAVSSSNNTLKRAGANLQTIGGKTFLKPGILDAALKAMLDGLEDKSASLKAQISLLQKALLSFEGDDQKQKAVKERLSDVELIKKIPGDVQQALTKIFERSGVKSITLRSYSEKSPGEPLVEELSAEELAEEFWKLMHFKIDQKAPPAKQEAQRKLLRRMEKILKELKKQALAVTGAVASAAPVRVLELTTPDDDEEDEVAAPPARGMVQASTVRRLELGDDASSHRSPAVEQKQEGRPGLLRRTFSFSRKKDD